MIILEPNRITDFSDITELAKRSKKRNQNTTKTTNLPDLDLDPLEAKVIQDLLEEDAMDLVFLHDDQAPKTQATVPMQEIDLDDLEEISLEDFVPSKPNTVTRQEDKKEKDQDIEIHYFALFYFIFCGFFLFLGIHFLRDMDQALIEYSAAQPEVYMDSFVTSLSDDEIVRHLLVLPEVDYSRFDLPSRLEDEMVAKISSASLSYQRSADFTTTQPTYTLFADQSPIGSLSLTANRSRELMNILPIYSYSCDQILVETSIVPKSYTIQAPSTVTVLVNGVELDDTYLVKMPEPIEELLPMSTFTEIPTMKTYQIDHLIFEPDFTVINLNGRYINYRLTDGSLLVPPSFEVLDFPASMLVETNLTEITEMISLYLSQDLKGKDHGLSEIIPYLYPSSSCEEELVNTYDALFSQGIPKHSLPEFPFTSIDYSSYTRYTETLFSITVTLEKNLLLSDGSNTHQSSLETYHFYLLANPDTESEIHWQLVSFTRE